MLGSFDGQFATGVEVDDLGNAVEQAAVLTQYVLIVFGPGQLHMHETLTAPGERERWDRRQTLLKDNKGRKPDREREGS